MLVLVAACAAAPVDFAERAPCPASPNCVSTLATDALHQIAPMTADATAMERIVAIIEGMPRTQLVTRRADYLHATFTSALFRFVDDVEVWVDGDTLHVRSASRVGYGDMGVNRARIEAIRAAFLAGTP